MSVDVLDVLLDEMLDVILGKNTDSSRNFSSGDRLGKLLGDAEQRRWDVNLQRLTIAFVVQPAVALTIGSDCGYDTPLVNISVPNSFARRRRYLRKNSRTRWQNDQKRDSQD
jgi:hypothetical protein